MKRRHLLTGQSGEQAAVAYLTAKGFTVLTKNWRPSGSGRNLELDIVGRWESSLVFVEVKTRLLRHTQADTYDAPAGLHNFTSAKQRNLIKAGNFFLAEQNLWSEACRFDLICVTFYPESGQHVDHYRDVIELGTAMAGGDSSWQPW